MSTLPTLCIKEKVDCSAFIEEVDSIGGHSDEVVYQQMAH